MIYNFSNIEELKNNFRIFENNVLKKQKDFILLVHASWCGHCIQLLPIWNNSIKNHSKLNIITIESDVYKHLQSTKKSHMFTKFLDNYVEGFPTLLKVENNEIIPFTDRRDERSITKFLKKNKSKASSVLEKYAHK